MRVDTHCHTRGSDGRSSPSEIAEAAVQAGLDVLCLTDHHTNVTDACLETADALIARGVWPVVGCEYSTAQGHLLVYGVRVELRRWGDYPEMQAVVDDVVAEGGACIVPHPYKSYTKRCGDLIGSLRGVSGFEIFNGHSDGASSYSNREAAAGIRKFGLEARAIAASDAHSADEVGLVWNEFPDYANTTRGFLEALKAGEFTACVDTDRLRARRALRAREERREREREIPQWERPSNGFDWQYGFDWLSPRRGGR